MAAECAQISMPDIANVCTCVMLGRWWQRWPWSRRRSREAAGGGTAAASAAAAAHASLHACMRAGCAKCAACYMPVHMFMLVCVLLTAAVVAAAAAAGCGGSSGCMRHMLTLVCACGPTAVSMLHAGMLCAGTCQGRPS